MYILYNFNLFLSVVRIHYMVPIQNRCSLTILPVRLLFVNTRLSKILGVSNVLCGFLTARVNLKHISHRSHGHHSLVSWVEGAGLGGDVASLSTSQQIFFDQWDP